jgi:hypothetical protein
MTTVSPDLEVRPSPGKGRGLFAKTKIPAGTRIIAEKAVIHLPNTDSSSLAIYDYYLTLPQATKDEYLQLAYANTSPPANYAYEIWKALRDSNRKEDIVQEASTVAAIFQNNAFGNDGKEQLSYEDLYLKISLLNNSCSPNACCNNDDELQTCYIHVVRDIEPNEEIAIAYTDVLVSVKTRAKFFMESWGFLCACPACDLNTTFGKESNHRRQKIEELQVQADTVKDLSAEEMVRRLPAIYEQILELMEQEDVITIEKGQM